MTSHQVTVRPDDAPIFIVGAPRSGTSLLRNLLNRHPAIALCDETYYFYYVYGRRRAFGDLSDATARLRLIQRYLATTRIQRLGLDPKALADSLMREGTTYPAFFAALLRCYAAAHQRRRCGEKTPQHALFTGILYAWYPHCRVIHVVRDPRDVVSSLLRMPWGSRNPLTNARLWLRCVLAADRWRERDNYLRVQYERLVATPESELRRICTFLAEDYRREMLAAGGQPPADAWWFDRARAPIQADRTGAWRRELTPEQVAAVEWIAAGQMHTLGYEPTGRFPSPVARLRTSLGAVVDGVTAAIRGFPRMWYYWFQPTRLDAEEAWIDWRSGASGSTPVRGT